MIRVIQRLSSLRSHWPVGVIQLWIVRPKPYARFGVTNFTMKKHIALGLVASTLFLAGCCTSPHHTAWEYKTAIVIPDAAHDVNLNKLAVDGWTIQSMSQQQSGGYLVVLKKPKQ
jgi:uncharacterized lipoprotein YajG